MTQARQEQSPEQQGSIAHTDQVVGVPTGDAVAKGERRMLPVQVFGMGQRRTCPDQPTRETPNRDAGACWD